MSVEGIQSRGLESLPKSGQKLTPRCPFCKDDPARVAISRFLVEGLVAVTIYCGNLKCRKILAIQVLGEAVREPGLIQTPMNGKGLVS